MSKLKDLREQRAREHAELTRVLTGADSAESRETAKKLIASIDAAKAEIEKIETKGMSRVGEGTTNERDLDHRRATIEYFRKGEARMSAENRAVLEQRTTPGISEGTLNIGAATGIGYFVPQGFVYDVETACKYYCPFLDNSVFGRLDTATGNALPYPTSNDTTEQAELEGEAAQADEIDITASRVNFAAWKYGSGVVRASLELIQDSAFPIESWLAENFGRRFGRKLENDFTNGTGSQMPMGLLTAIAGSGANPVTATGANENSGNAANTALNSIGSRDLTNLEHSVDPCYRRGASYMLHDQTLAAIKTILDKFGRPLWQVGIADSEPDTLNGYPLVVNQSMPQIGSVSEASVLAFGDLKKFLIRKVRDFSVLVLRERYAEFGQTGYISWMRVDSQLLDAGTHPVNVLNMHS